MDPLHITEFASDRYFEKLNQTQGGSQQQPGQVVEGPSTVPPSLPLHASQFILPLRGSNPQEAARFVEEPAARPDQKRRGFLGFRKLHSSSKPSTVSSSIAEPILDRRPSFAESTKQSFPFDQLFHCLPNELQVQIISSLPLSDILNLRLASRSLHELVSLNETPIVRYHLDHHIPAYAKRLYPVPEGKALNFHYLCGIWHRLHVAAKLSSMMSQWITKDIFLRKTNEQRQEFAPQTERMRRRLIPLLFTTFHFFETYRDLHMKHIIENDGVGLSKEPYTVNPIEKQIMDMYDDQTLLRVHQVFPLVISSFCRRLRPPSYIGSVERSLRGYLKDKPSDEIHVAILCIGGLREVERLWEVKGYNSRRAAVDLWYNAIAKDDVEPEPKKRRGMLGLGRKKPSVVSGKSSTPEPAMTRQVSHDSTASGIQGTGFVFNTSLSAGMPMDSMPKEQLKVLLPDLPVLQEIWLQTAEALILERKIVERPADIKRNAQVMLELIRDDGIEEEDEWWYGHGTPESLRPNLEAIEEDALE